MEVRLAYFSYPYSDDPEKRTDEAVWLATKIFEKYRLFPIVPHAAVDVFQGRVPVVDILRAEHVLIQRSDVFIIGSKEKSQGMMWELAYARELGKPVYRVVEEKGEYWLEAVDPHED
ncbi:MAG: hypothetical protein QW334_00445 [Thermofilum sp.]